MMRDPGSTPPLWPDAPALMRLPREEIHVWLAALDADGADAADMRDLSESEVTRARAMRTGVHRCEFVAARQILRRLLGRYLDREPAQIALRISEYGKPALADCLGTTLQFNVSHSAGHALLAFSCASVVGVDIDRLDRVAHWQAIARNNFAAPEQAALSALPPDQQSAAFMRNWIGKEAYTKGRGSGFQYGFRGFSLASTAHSCTLLSDKLDPNAVSEWSLVALDLAPPLAATLAFQGPATTAVHCWNYPFRCCSRTGHC